MSGTAVILALAMFLASALLRVGMTRKWFIYFIYPQIAEFPKLCPMCLSTDADHLVEEKSLERMTKTWVVAHRFESWRVKVPHCRRCSSKLERNGAIGIAAGAICAVAAILLFPPQELSVGSICYVLFGYPAWVVASNLQKGFVCGQWKNSLLMVRIRREEYFNQLEQANPLRVVRNPLASSGM
jgi:hypothetical protein